MKRILSLLMMTALISSSALIGRGSGGAVAAGVAAGLFTGVATSAIANGNNSRASRAEQEAAAARYETEQLRRDQERERLEQVRREVERRDDNRKDEQIRQLSEHIRNIERQGGASNWMLYLLFGFIFVLSLAVGVLGLVLMRRRP